MKCPWAHWQRRNRNHSHQTFISTIISLVICYKHRVSRKTNYYQREGGQVRNDNLEKSSTSRTCRIARLNGEAVHQEVEENDVSSWTCRVGSCVIGEPVSFDQGCQKVVKHVGPHFADVLKWSDKPIQRWGRRKDVPWTSLSLPTSEYFKGLVSLYVKSSLFWSYKSSIDEDVRRGWVGVCTDTLRIIEHE